MDEMNRVMLAYLVCPQRWQSTIGNQNDCPLKKIYFEAFNFLLMQNNLNFILQNFRAGVWATQKSKKKPPKKPSSHFKVLLKIPNFRKLPFFSFFTPIYCLLNIFFNLYEKVEAK